MYLLNSAYSLYNGEEMECEDDTHLQFCKVEGSDGKTSTLQYAMVLGTLCTIHRPSNRTCLDIDGIWGRAFRTPYVVVLNAADKSIWVMLAPYFFDDLGCEHPSSEQDHTWDFLGTSSSGRQSFDVMKVMKWDEFTKRIAIFTRSSIELYTCSAWCVLSDRRSSEHARWMEELS